MSTIDPMMATPHWALWLLLGLGMIGFWWVVAYVTGSMFGPDEEDTDRDTSGSALAGTLRCPHH